MISARYPSLYETLAFISIQALDAALKQFKTLAPNMAVMFFSIDHDNNKVLCFCLVPNVSVSKVLYRVKFS